jgi:site-specific DNA-adenine methylase
MKENRLNLMSYYGGKANMSSMISDMLDYRYSKVYIELFGGAGSVLLNKIPHDIEIYNEYNLGIYTLFKVLKNKDTATELIDRLYRSSEYSKDCFMDAMAYRNRVEDNPMVENTRLLFEYIKEIQSKHNIEWYKEYASGKGIDINIHNLNLTPSEIKIMYIDGCVL